MLPFVLGALDLLNGPLGKKLENSASYHLICLTKVNQVQTMWVDLIKLCPRGYCLSNKYRNIR